MHTEAEDQITTTEPPTLIIEIIEDEKTLGAIVAEFELRGLHCRFPPRTGRVFTRYR